MTAARMRDVAGVSPVAREFQRVTLWLLEQGIRCTLGVGLLEVPLPGGRKLECRHQWVRGGGDVIDTRVVFQQQRSGDLVNFREDRLERDGDTWRLLEYVDGFLQEEAARVLALAGRTG